MNKNKKRILLCIMVAIIMLAIFFIQKTKSESRPQDVQKEEVTKKITAATPEETKARLALKEKQYPKAVELVDPDGYLNAEKITIGELVGKKIILVDFWTYSCINCQRTIPYLNDWYIKYKDKGFVIIGVHTPEFDFEKDRDNVRRAIEKFGIAYPIVQDNSYKTWTAYENHYWPRKYLIDIDGFIVYDHIGEGAYEETEVKIQELLNERNAVLGTEKSAQITVKEEQKKESVSFENILRTPEIYFGYQFARNQLGNPEGWQSEKTVSYTLPEERKKNLLYLEGTWKNNPDNMELASKEGKILLNFFAKEVNIVAGSNEPVKLKVFVDGAFDKEIIVKDFDLYNLLAFERSWDHRLEIRLSEPGLMAYTFTFG